ncbi:MAG: hypothetical protein JWN34_459 [Bryobacterales bacterium]|nr:hypothetical protein [Bryobacterales bacterium]
MPRRNDLESSKLAGSQDHPCDADSADTSRSLDSIEAVRSDRMGLSWVVAFYLVLRVVLERCSQLSSCIKITAGKGAAASRFGVSRASRRLRPSCFRKYGPISWSCWTCHEDCSVRALTVSSRRKPGPVRTLLVGARP